MKQLLIFIFLVLITGVGLYIYYVNSPYSKGIKRTFLGKKESLVIRSNAFSNGENIPTKYTCDGANVSPQFTFSVVPVGSRSLAIVVEDKDSNPPNFTHWILFDLNPLLNGLDENSTPPDGATEGLNDFADTHYRGPCPPSGTHNYVFRLYALDSVLGLPKTSTKQELISKMQGHIIEEAELNGVYKKQ